MIKRALVKKDYVVTCRKPGKLLVYAVILCAALSYRWLGVNIVETLE